MLISGRLYFNKGDVEYQTKFIEMVIKTSITLPVCVNVMELNINK